MNDAGVADCLDEAKATLRVLNLGLKIAPRAAPPAAGAKTATW
jgi:hypothetical protein